MASIRTKKEFYRLYHAGRLGNTIRQWDWFDWRDLYLNEQDPKDVLGWAVRVKIPDNPYMRYEMDRQQCYTYAMELWNNHRIDPEKIQISELCWDFGPSSGRSNYLLLQGEFRRSGGERRPPIHGLFTFDFYPEAERNRMRVSMQRAQEMEGLEAWTALKEACDAPSWEMIQDLLDEYPDDTIEFACYRGSVGVLGINTVIWEVRGY